MKNAVLFKIKNGYLDEWKNWCREIQEERYVEAKDTLVEEGLSQEVAFLFKYDSGYYILGFIDGVGLPANPEREINKIHKEKKERCLEYIGPAEILYHIK